jgi:hypothetical protein
VELIHARQQLEQLVREKEDGKDLDEVMKTVISEAKQMLATETVPVEELHRVISKLSSAGSTREEPPKQQPQGPKIEEVD